MHDPIAKRALAGLLLAAALLFITLTTIEIAEARAPRGGRSFSGSRTFSRPATAPRTTPPPAPGSATASRQPFGSSSFMRGMAGGLLGGMVGGMIFGRPAYGAMGGFGGSGIGLIEILILGGLAWFLFKRFVRPAHTRGGVGAVTGRIFDAPYDRLAEDGNGSLPDIAPAGGGERGIEAVRRSDPRFDPDLFREGAQDVFFKIQAAWMRRELSLVEGLIGSDLAEQYRRQMADMKARGTVNRLENIAVRSVEIVDAGTDGGHAWITVKFIANLLDYTVDEHTDKVIDGDPAAPVKFEESWTFAAPQGTSAWKLEAIA